MNEVKDLSELTVDINEVDSVTSLAVPGGKYSSLQDSVDHGELIMLKVFWYDGLLVTEEVTALNEVSVSDLVTLVTVKELIGEFCGARFLTIFCIVQFKIPLIYTSSL